MQLSHRSLTRAISGRKNNEIESNANTNKIWIVNFFNILFYINKFIVKLKYISLKYHPEKLNEY